MNSVEILNLLKDSRISNIVRLLQQPNYNYEIIKDNYLDDYYVIKVKNNNNNTVKEVYPIEEEYLHAFMQCVFEINRRKK